METWLTKEHGDILGAMTYGGVEDYDFYTRKLD
jgi:hypothetical protein